MSRDSQAGQFQFTNSATRNPRHGRADTFRYQLKTPYRDGTTHVIFEPLDFIAKLAALVPKPRVNLTRLDEERPCSPPFRQPSVVQIHSR